jgi:hypothetical protein
MLTTQVALSEIDLKDKTYILSDIVPDQKLIQSISDLGLLNPVKLIKIDNGYIKQITAISLLPAGKELMFSCNLVLSLCIHRFIIIMYC